jgi:hypothetical protein
VLLVIPDPTVVMLVRITLIIQEHQKIAILVVDLVSMTTATPEAKSGTLRLMIVATTETTTREAMIATPTPPEKIVNLESMMTAGPDNRKIITTHKPMTVMVAPGVVISVTPRVVDLSLNLVILLVNLVITTNAAPEAKIVM